MSLLVLLAFLGVWEGYVDLGGVDPLVLPAPHQIAQALWVDRGTLASGLVVTGVEVLLGIALAAIVALVVALAIHMSGRFRQAVYPLLAASQAIPIVILAPILVVWLGFGLFPKLVVIGLVCFFPIVVTTIAALEQVDPELLKLLATFDATRYGRLRLVELPAALPGLLTGVKLAAVFSVIGAVFAEQSGSSSGLGYLLTVTHGALETSEEFAAVVVLCAFAIGLFTLVTVIERRMLPWAYRANRQ